ncbi:disulfide bond formation protein DsbA [[Phormidium ambiguum] IAM M-71]|uniref:Disulfide bond formation protein DsbA n=1 Tax=[Phormidium ambiguum] IAM M-71 TaxID=454136 RepID=A0A1U7ILW8_9CYAN|nr:thioredoxin domain-containing protein [Phormidium ambiguum]OKH38159.1 disulfide bond formation protein DsbA [Phormidium ambiguum IAM M-71]
MPIIRIFLLLLTLTFLLWTTPVQAATKIPTQLEEQVLQIIRQHPEAIVESVQAYQEKIQNQLAQAQQAFVQQMKTNPDAIISQSPVTGSPAKKIILVEFSDFQCPYCAQAHKTIKEFMAKHQDEVTLVYKHFPLSSIHPEALPAAKASWAAGQQGKFWQYHDALFTQQNKLGEEFYLETAKNLNLDLEKFNSDRQIAEKSITEDMILGESVGISGTPFFIMNGATFSGAVQLTEVENVLARVK